MAIYRVIGKGEENKYFDDKARENVIDYCLRDSKTPHSYTGSRAINIDNAVSEMNALARLYNNDDRVRLRHSIISFDDTDNISPAQAAEIAEDAVKYFGDEHQVLYSVHEDANHVHIHMVMNQVSYQDGHKYRGTKKEHYNFINYMKKVVHPYGIDFTPVSDA